MKALLPHIHAVFDWYTVARLAREAEAAGCSLASFLDGTDGAGVLDRKVLNSVREILDVLDECRQQCASISVMELLHLVWKTLFPDADPHDAAFGELCALAQPFVSGPASENLPLFLDAVILWKDGETYRPQAEAVTLSSAHGAKGLEFPVVFLIGLEDGIFPWEAAGEQPSDPEEERRLFYVAMTRAKRTLYLSWSQERRLFGERRNKGPSRFIHEIPAAQVVEVCEKHNHRAREKPKARQRSLF
jgi:DNA helicase-2/ATP-dependent DNA helicase PcrA